jgi:hypothetical protein
MFSKAALEQKREGFWKARNWSGECEHEETEPVYLDTRTWNLLETITNW